MPDAAKNYSITELEFFGLAINIFAFRQLLSHVHFDCYCDHSAITYILKSKRTPPTRRIRKLIEELMQFNFSIYYLPGAKMHIADVLSRLAGRDLDPPKLYQFLSMQCKLLNSSGDLLEIENHR